MRLTAASVVVALAAAVLGLCGGGMALAATASSSMPAVLGKTMPGSPAASPVQPSWGQPTPATSQTTKPIEILPIAGADTAPLAVVAAICLVGGSAALIAGRPGRLTSAPQRRARHRRTGR